MKRYHHRKTQGSAHAGAKLTESDVIEIRAAYEDEINRITLAQLALDYGVSTTVIWNVVHGLTWRHVAMADEDSQS